MSEETLWSHSNLPCLNCGKTKGKHYVRHENGPRLMCPDNSGQEYGSPLARIAQLEQERNRLADRVKELEGFVLPFAKPGIACGGKGQPTGKSWAWRHVRTARRLLKLDEETGK